MEAGILNSIGIQIPILIAIVGICEIFKKFIPKKHKWAFILITIVLSFGMSVFITSPFDWREYLLNSFVYLGASTIFYNTLIRLTNKGIERVKLGIDEKKIKVKKEAENNR